MIKREPSDKANCVPVSLVRVTPSSDRNVKTEPIDSEVVVPISRPENESASSQVLQPTLPIQFECIKDEPVNETNQCTCEECRGQILVKGERSSDEGEYLRTDVEVKSEVETDREERRTRRRRTAAIEGNSWGKYSYIFKCFY